jgi:hypothetical protein
VNWWTNSQHQKRVSGTIIIKVTELVDQSQERKRAGGPIARKHRDLVDESEERKAAGLTARAKIEPVDQWHEKKINSADI